MTIKLVGVKLPSGPAYPNINDFDKITALMSGNPLTDGLIGAYVFTSESKDIKKNYANTALPLLQNGSPVISKGSASLSRQGGYFNTQLTLSGFSMMFVLLKPDANQKKSQMLVSSYLKDSTGSSGDALYISSAAISVAAGTTATSVTVARQTMPSTIAQSATVVASIINTAPAAAPWGYDASGSFNHITTALASRNYVNKPLLIGASYSDTEFLDSSDIAAVLIYNKDPGSSNTITQIANWLKNTVNPALNS